MKYCSRCGNALLDSDMFCSKCGAAVLAEPCCANCGAELRPGAEFCWKCGAAVLLDDGATIPLDDEATVSLDDEKTLPLNAVSSSGDYEYISLGDEPEPLPEEEPKKKGKTGIVIGAVAAVLAIGVIAFFVTAPGREYSAALELMESGSYDEAIVAFTELGDYKDSAEKITEAKELKTAERYEEAVDLFNTENYPEAGEIFSELGSYKDSVTMVLECDYREAVNLIESGDFANAEAALAKAKEHPDYREAKDAYYIGYTEHLVAEGKFTEAKEHYESKAGYDETASVYLEILVGCAKELTAEGKYTEAVALLEKPEEKETPGAKDARQEAMYSYAAAHKDKNDKTTKTYLNKLSKEKYKDSAKLKTEIFGEETESGGSNSSSNKPNSVTFSGDGLGWLTFKLNFSKNTPPHSSFYIKCSMNGGKTQTIKIWPYYDYYGTENIIGKEWRAEEINYSGTNEITIKIYEGEKLVLTERFKVEGAKFEITRNYR